MRRRFKLKNIILYNADYSSKLFQRNKTIFVCSDFVKDAHERLKIMNKSVKLNSEAVTGGVLSEKVFLEISQNSQENNAKVSLPEACNFI